MSLNDDAVSDLQTPLQQNTSVQLVTKVDNTYDEPQKDEDPKSLLATLPETAQSIKLIRDQSSRVVELEDVASEVMDADAIDQSGAETIAAAFEGLFDHVRLSEYTRTPSKTNLVFTKRFMANHITLVKESLQTNFSAFLEKPLTDTKDLLEEIQEDYIPTLQNELAKIQTSALTLKEAIMKNPNLVLPDGTSFLNLKNTVLQESEKATALLSKPEWKTLGCAMANFRSLWKEYTVLRSLLVGVKENTPLDGMFDYATMGAAASETFKIDQLIDIMSSHYLISVLVQMNSNVQGHIERVDALASEGLKLIEDPSKVQDFIVENGKEIQDMVASIHHYAEAVVSLTLLIPNVKILLTGFASFK